MDSSPASTAARAARAASSSTEAEWLMNTRSTPAAMAFTVPLAEP